MDGFFKDKSDEESFNQNFQKILVIILKVIQNLR